jgi:hypothetical protein
MARVMVKMAMLEQDECAMHMEYKTPLNTGRHGIQDAIKYRTPWNTGSRSHLYSGRDASQAPADDRPMPMRKKAEGSTEVKLQVIFSSDLGGRRGGGGGREGLRNHQAKGGEGERTPPTPQKTPPLPVHLLLYNPI